MKRIYPDYYSNTKMVYIQVYNFFLTTYLAPDIMI